MLLKLSCIALSCIACSSTLPAPPLGSAKSVGTASCEEVPFPPPPARVESVPDAPRSDADWVDGEWSWNGRRWAWNFGRWVTAQEKITFTPWHAYREPDGTLMFCPGVWKDQNGRDAPEPASLARSRS